jgi:hypothetical protein
LPCGLAVPAAPPSGLHCDGERQEAMLEGNHARS